MSDSTTTIVGTLGQDPALRYTPGGQAVTTLNVAVRHRFQRNGEWDEKTSWFEVVCWQSLAENAAASLTKGSRVIVTGRLETREYEAKDGSGKRTATQIVADGIGPELRFATVQVERTERSAPRVDRAPDPIFGDESEF